MKYILVFSERIHGLFAGLILSVILTRNLDVGEFGIYKTLISYASIMAMTMYFSLDDIMVRYLPELKKKEGRTTNAVLNNLLLLRLTSISVILGAAYLFRGELLEVSNLSIDDNLLNPYLALLFLLSYNNLIGRAFFTGDGRRSSLAVVLIVKDSLKVLLLLALWAFSSLDLQGVFGALLALESAAAVFYTLDYLKGKRRFAALAKGMGTGLRKRVLRYGAGNYLRQSSHSMRDTSVDIAVVAAVASTGAAGLYGVATILPTFVRTFSIFKMFYGVLLPEVVHDVELQSQEGKREVISRFLSLDRIQMVVLIPVALSVIVLLDNVIRHIYTDRYLPSVSCAIILVVGVFFLNMTDVFSILLNLFEMNKIMAVVTMTAGVSNLVLDLVLVYLVGFVGAAIATTIISISVFLFYVFYFKSKGMLVFQAPRTYFMLSVLNLPFLITTLCLVSNSSGLVLELFVVGCFSISSLVFGYFLVFEADERDFVKQNILERFSRC